MSKRRPLPYAACRLLDDALMAASTAARANLQAIDPKTNEVDRMRQHVIIAVQIETVVKRIREVKGIRDEK